MTVIKLTKSKKAVQIITDEGFIYQTSVNSLTYLLSGKSSFITTMRLPFNVSADRYKPSEVWTDGGRIDPRSIEGPSRISQDGISVVGQRKSEERKTYKDKDVIL